eukprot:1343482-Pyramimonas_sp.AAC.1
MTAQEVVATYENGQTLDAHAPRILEHLISRSDLQRLIASVPSGSAAGPGGAPYEVLKKSPRWVRPHLAPRLT